MTRPLRINYPGAIYHITARGNELKNIFYNDADRKFFLNLLAKVKERFSWKCYAYCLMDNHYHLLIETPKANLSLGMRQLNGVYTQHFNALHNRVGHLFQGRFKGIIVQKDSHALELCRYIVLNPVRAQICLAPAHYIWSSYSEIKANRPFKAITEKDWILSQFDSNTSQAAYLYENFVKDGYQERPWEKLKGQIYFGNDKFVRDISKNILSQNEIPKRQTLPLRPQLEELLKCENGILLAYSKYNFRLNEIAKALNVHYSTVSRRIKALEMLHCKT